MCNLPVEDPRAEGRPPTASDMVEDLCLLLNQARFYGPAHRSVEDALRRATATLEALLAAHGHAPVEIGCADGYLFFEERPLLDAERAAARLRPLLEALGAGGLAFQPGAGRAEVQAFLALAGRRDLKEMGVEAANAQLDGAGGRGLRLLGPYRVTAGPQDLATRTMGGTRARSETGTADHAVLVPERIYESVFDHLTDVMTRLMRGDLFLVDETRGQVEALLQRLSADAASILTAVDRRTTRSDVFQFRHLIRVACLALHFARALTDDRATLLRVGTAALLHDIGKRDVPQAVLTHHGRLEGEMLAAMQSHTVHGARILMQLPDADPLAVAVAFGHHRELESGGYPRVLHAVALSTSTRMVKICDVYEALTAERPYKDPMPPRRAYRVMLSMTGHFDLPLLHRFILVNGIWPVGTLVELEGGAHARVVGQTEDLDRPRVRVEGEEEVLDLRTGRGAALGAIRHVARSHDPIRVRRTGAAATSA